MCGRTTDRLRWKKPGDLRRLNKVKEQPASDRSRVGFVFCCCESQEGESRKRRIGNEKGKKWKEGEAQNGR